MGKVSQAPASSKSGLWASSSLCVVCSLLVNDAHCTNVLGDLCCKMYARVVKPYGGGAQDRLGSATVQRRVSLRASQDLSYARPLSQRLETLPRAFPQIEGDPPPGPLPGRGRPSPRPSPRWRETLPQALSQVEGDPRRDPLRGAGRSSDRPLALACRA